MMSKSGDARGYAKSCQTDFWKAVFDAEAAYLVEHLTGAVEMLSVGCGPAVIEGMLGKRGFHVTGLDISEQALERAPDGIRAVVGRAEEMPFPEASFDAVIFVASLQFVDDYRKAVKQAARVLRREGRLIVMLLNPESAFFKMKRRDPDSYVQKMKHQHLKEIEDAINQDFVVGTEYCLGIREDLVFESRDPREAALYVITGSRAS